MTTPQQKKANNRMALVLATIALAFFVGVIAKFFFLGK